MAFSIKKVQEKTIPLTIEFDSQILELQLRSAVFTPKFGKEIEAIGKDSMHEANIQSLVRGIVDWNIEDEEGNKIPVNEENISTLPYPLVLETIEKLFSTISGNAPQPNR